MPNDASAGEAALTAFEESSWGKKYPAIGQSWRRAWAEVIPFYAKFLTVPGNAGGGNPNNPPPPDPSVIPEFEPL
jgi:hypothetical protein